MSMLKKLVNNSKKAIKNDVYDITTSYKKSNLSLEKLIKNNKHASLITEIKFASPSSGKIKEYSDPVVIAQSMINGGAIGLSIITQPYLFNGTPDILIAVRKKIKNPILMKDIIINKIQIDAASKMGADYILLIQSIFDKGYVKDIDEMIDYSKKKKLNVILETHTKSEFLNALNTNADIIGINNRNLDTLDVDLNVTKIILHNNHKKKIIISESGITTTKDIKFLYKCGANAFLIGTNIMNNNNNNNIEQHVKKLVYSL